MSEVKFSSGQQNNSASTPAFTLSGHHAITQHQVTAVVNGTLTGTLTLSAKIPGGNIYEPVNDAAGNPISINLASPSTVQFTGVIDSLKITPSGLSGSGLYDIVHKGY
jgi:hypothetical protein